MNPGFIIRQQRLRLGITQTRVAKMLGCHRSRYHRLETGKLRWRWEDIDRVCRYLGLDIELIRKQE